MPDSALLTTPSRRAVFTDAGALLAGAALSAAPALPADLNPDAELIRICEQHLRNMDAFNADPEDGGPDNPLWVEYERTRNAINDARPVTIAGMIAKAKAAKREALQPDGSEHPGNCPAEDWAWDLVNDLLRLGEGRS